MNMKSLESVVKSTARSTDELRRSIELESEQVHAVLRAVDEMELNPRTPVPHGRFMPAFLRWLWRFTAVPIGFAVALCAVGWLLNELTAYDAALVFGAALILGGPLAAIFSAIVAGTSVLLSGEQLSDGSYLGRVRHDYENAIRLIGFSEGTLKQAAAITKRKIDNIVDIRVFFLSFLGGAGTLAFALLRALEVPSASPWYGDAARLSALGGLVVAIGYFYSFKPLPRLRYNLSVIELAQQCEREPLSEDLAPEGRSDLSKKRLSLFKAVVGVASYWLISRMHR